LRLLVPARLAAAILGALAVAFGAASWKLGYWVQGVPGPGLLPLGTSVLLLPAVFFLLRTPLAPDDETTLSKTALLGLALCGGCALVMPWLGAVLPAIALATLWMRLFGRRPWPSSLFMASVMVAALALLFIAALKVPVPLWPMLG
jgi:hypothetical protein